MPGEPSAVSPPRGMALARLALGDLQRLQTLALEALARAEGVALLAGEDPSSLPLAGEDPFGTLAGQEPGSGQRRPAGGAKGGRSPALGDPGAGPVAAPEGTAREPRPRSGWGTEAAPSSDRAPEEPVPAAGSGPASFVVLQEETASSAARGRGAGPGELVQVLAGRQPIAGPEARREGRARLAAGPTGARTAAGAPALPEPSERSGRRPVALPGSSEPVSAWSSVPALAGAVGRREESASPGSEGGRAGGGGSESAPAAAGGPALPTTVRRRLGELADEALAAGDADRRLGSPEGSSVGAPDRAAADPAPRSGPQNARRGTSLEGGIAPGAARAAADLLDRRGATVAPGSRGGFLPEGRPVPPLDPDELAELVSDALVRQARRHGVDLS